MNSSGGWYTKSLSEPFHPRPQFDLPAPNASWLLDQMPTAVGDRVRIEQRAGLVGRFRITLAADRTVYDEVHDMDTLRLQLARHALLQPTQGKLAHRERGRLRISLHAGRGAGENDYAATQRQHAPHRLLRHQESGES